ncbi:MAG: lysoplasmalogenase [Sandaracinaceae bacterium]|nr:lysoplasmalogenase [Sandaracinaceae bacterium]
MLPYVVAMCVLVALVLWAIRTSRPWLEWIAKPLAALTFIAAALHQGALEARWTSVLFGGLVLAAIGDVLLIPKSKKSFLAGLVAFLLGHVGYAIAFAVRGLHWPAAGMSGAVLVVAAIPIVRWLWPHVERPMRAPVIVYVIVITAMVALAVGTFARSPDARLPIGAFCFYLSDLAVARHRFVKASFFNRAWGLPLYFGSQLILAWSA